MIQLDCDRLLSIEPSWCVLIPGQPSEIERMETEFRRGLVLRVIDGAKCITKVDTIREIGKALDFPTYCGEVWDSFEECIRDLDQWINADAFAIVFKRSELVLPSNQRDFATLLSILKSAAEYWGMFGRNSESAERPKPFHVVFQCDPRNVTEVSQRIMSTDVKVDQLNSF